MRIKTKMAFYNRDSATLRLDILKWSAILKLDKLKGSRTLGRRTRGLQTRGRRRQNRVDTRSAMSHTVEARSVTSHHLNHMR